MWFAKWFGGRDEAVEEDEPARHVAPEVSKPVQELMRSKTRVAGKPDARANATGFDPYNSGAFERSNAWERIGRRR
jgi:hypothetical protein